MIARKKKQRSFYAVACTFAAAFAAASSGAAAPSSGPPSWRELRFVDSASPSQPFRGAEATGKPRVLVLWRADCGPCLIEMEGLGKLEAAARAARPGAQLVAVAMNGAAGAKAKLDAMGVRPERQWTALDPDAQVLSALNGPPPRLPLSVAIDSKGRLCGRRLGLLGTDRVKQWMRRCS